MPAGSQSIGTEVMTAVFDRRDGTWPISFHESDKRGRKRVLTGHDRPARTTAVKGTEILAQCH